MSPKRTRKVNELPYIPLGPFQWRIPGIHYKLEYVEFFQGLILGATALSSIPYLTDNLGLSYELAWSCVIIEVFMYMLHGWLGDPVVPGWITPTLPFTLAYLNGFPKGPERIQAMIALQLLVAFVFIFMGITKLADKFVNGVPNSIKGGILIAAPITALLSMVISYLVVKKKFRSKGFIEFVSMLAMAVPGTVLGIGYIRGYANGIFHTGVLSGIYGTGIILIIVFIVRSLPVGTRSGISALRQIDKSIEESAYDLGAGSGRVFTTVTLPLIKDSFFSGLVTSFVRSITAISAIILLVTPQFLLITCQINEFAEKGYYGVACAYATILIAIVYLSVLLMNLFIRFFGTSKKIKEEK